MNIELSWNLFIVGFFVIIMAYSFIIGKNETLKVIISTYIATLAADGVGNIAFQVFTKYSPLARNITPELLEKYTLIAKVVFLIVLIVFIVVKGEFSVDIDTDAHFVVRMGASIVFGVLSAGLIISTILVFMSGGSFLGLTGGDLDTSAIAELLQSSRVARIMVYNYNWWFAVPALAFVLDSMINTQKNA